MRNRILTAALLLSGLAFWQCGSSSNEKELDTYATGAVKIAADQSFEPLIAAELDAFHAAHPRATITPVYTSEGEAINAMLLDSVRVAVVTRTLTPEEEESLTRIKYKSRVSKIAVDGVALVLNKANPDTLYTLEELKQLLTGQLKNWSDLSGPYHSRKDKEPVVLVFDKSSSSNLAFVAKKLGLKMPDLKGQLFAPGSNNGVIDYVEAHPNAIGFVGMNWISDKEDSAQSSNDRRIKVAHLADTANPTPADFYPPAAATIALKEYPLTREVYAITREARFGLGRGFIAYMTGDAGQRIILKAGLMPANVPMRIIKTKDRDFNITE